MWAGPGAAVPDPARHAHSIVRTSLLETRSAPWTRTLTSQTASEQKSRSRSPGADAQRIAEWRQSRQLHSDRTVTNSFTASYHYRVARSRMATKHDYRC